MSQQELLTGLLGALNGLRIPYMLTGSVSRIAAAFAPPRFYLDAEDAKDSVRRGSMFNLVDAAAGGHDPLQAPLGAALRRELWERLLSEASRD